MARHGDNQIAQIAGGNLRTAREAHGFTQQQVAEAIGKSSRDVSRWECGVVEPGLANRLALASVLFNGDVAAMYTERVGEAA